MPMEHYVQTHWNQFANVITVHLYCNATLSWEVPSKFMKNYENFKQLIKLYRAQECNWSDIMV